MPDSTLRSLADVGLAAIRDNGGQVFNVKAQPFGAKGDGTTDDTDAIDAAISAAAAIGGGVVKLPPGTFFTRGHALPSNVHLEGSGRTFTKLVVRGDTSMSAGVQLVGVDHASVRGLTVDVRTNSPNCNGIAIFATSNDGTGTPPTFCTVEGCEILGFDSHQYLIWSQLGQHIKILFNWVDGAVTVRNPSSQQEGIEIQGGFDVLVMGNTVTNMGNSGIDPGTNALSTNMALDDLRIIGNSVNGANIGISVNAITGPTTTNPCSRIKILGNTVQNCLKYGCWLWSTGGSALFDIDISHNTFDGIGSSTQSFAYGFFAQGDSFTLADPSLCRDVRATDNLIRNVIASNAGAGANFASFPGLIFARNTVKDITTGTAAGLVSGNSPDLQILDNTMENLNAFAMSIQSGSNRATITGNQVRSWNAANTGLGGINLDSVSFCTITGNSFYQPPTGHDFFPMSPEGNCDSLTIHGNLALYATGYNVNLNAGTNPSSGIVSVSNGQTSVTVTNAQVNTNRQVRVYQKDGIPNNATLTVGSGSFTITLGAAAAGGVSFNYEIIP
jgi:hypothetical protein